MTFRPCTIRISHLSFLVLIFMSNDTLMRFWLVTLKTCFAEATPVIRNALFPFFASLLSLTFPVDDLVHPDRPFSKFPFLKFPENGVNPSPSSLSSSFPLPPLPLPPPTPGFVGTSTLSSSSSGEGTTIEPPPPESCSVSIVTELMCPVNLLQLQLHVTVTTELLLTIAMDAWYSNIIHRDSAPFSGPKELSGLESLTPFRVASHFTFRMSL
mmetsp:Transcript_10239/g.42911  ORF Transcript_10239/g.42911 Transcript_10239/m.42911 type:complete len:212 (+) Transcript_10239:346-981(+)